MRREPEAKSANGRFHRFARLGLLLGLVGMLTLLVAACGGDDATATPVPPQATATPDFQAEWDALLAAARAPVERPRPPPGFRRGLPRPPSWAF